MSDSRFQLLPETPIKLPEQFTYPFAYQPEDIALLAVSVLQSYLEEGHLPSDFGLQAPFQDIGKMFGVLVVRNAQNQLGYLAAFSGKIGTLIIDDYFVPPIYNTLDTNGRYKIEEIALNAINKQIVTLSTSTTLHALREAKKEKIAALALHKKQINAAQKQRQTARKLVEDTDANALQVLKTTHEQESFALRMAYKAHAAIAAKEIATLDQELAVIENEIAQLKQARKDKSSEVQTYLFEQYQFRNAKGSLKNALALFENENPSIPPAGTGECAAPKLLQYAYQHQYYPIALAEFWWGKTPNSENRTHKHFYPACTAKCKPVLTFMMEGLNVAADPDL